MNFKQFYEIIYLLIKLIVIIVFIYFLKDITNKDHVYHPYYELLGLQYFFGSTAITECIRNINSILIKYNSKTKYEIKYEDFMKKIDKNIQFYRHIKECLHICRFYIEKDKHFNNDNKETEDTKIINKMFSDIEFLLTFSEKSTYKFNLGSKIIDIDKYLDNYGSAKENIKNNVIMPFLQNISNNSINSNIKICPILLYGKPGTGKTKFAEDLCNTLEINMVKISDKKKYGYYDYREGIEKEKLSEYTLGIYESKKKYGHDYILVFIDEIDKKLFNNIDGKIIPNFDFFQEILKIFNGQRTIYDDYLRNDLNINNVLIIAASNMSLEEIIKCDKVFEPLLGRMIEIHIPNMTYEIKYNILVNRMKEKNQIDIPFIEKLINEIPDDGIRHLIKILDLYINKLNSIEFFKSTIWNDPDIELFKIKIFEKYKNISA